jgi:hypothetical protein
LGDSYIFKVNLKKKRRKSPLLWPWKALILCCKEVDSQQVAVYPHARGYSFLFMKAPTQDGNNTKMFLFSTNCGKSPDKSFIHPTAKYLFSESLFFVDEMILPAHVSW